MEEADIVQDDGETSSQTSGDSNVQGNLEDQAQAQESSLLNSSSDSFNNKIFNNAKRNVVPNCIALPPKKNTDLIKIFVVNARSALNKIDDIGWQFSDKEADICICSETWQSQDEASDELIESLEETYGVKWLGRGRMGRRGGGVSVIISNTFANARILDYSDPALETVWVAATPEYDKTITLIISAFYSSSTEEFKPERDALQTHYLDVMEQIEHKMGKVEYALGGGTSTGTVWTM